MKTYIMDIDVTVRLTENIEAESEDQAIEKARAIAYYRGEVLDWDYSVLSVEGEDD